MAQAAQKQPGTEISDPRVAELTTHLTNRMRRQFITRRGEVDLDWTTEVAYAFALLKANDYTMECALKSPESLGNALLDLADLGLSLAPSTRHAYLVPRSITVGKGDSQRKVPVVYGVPSYIGMEYKALASGAVTLIQSNIVFTQDHFEVWTDEHGRHIKHIEARGQRGQFECVYTLAKFANGEMHVETMNEEDLAKCWAAAEKANNGKPPMIGKDWLNEWRKKCCVRRAWKHWPSTPALQRLQEAMDRADPMDFGPQEERSQESQEPCLTTEMVAELTALMPFEPKRQESWLLNFAQALGHNNIRDVPISKFENLKERITKRVEATSKVKPS